MPRPTRTRFTERTRPSREAARRDDEATAVAGGWTNPAVVIAVFGLVVSAVFTIHMLSTAEPAPPLTDADAAATVAAAAAADAQASITDTLGLTDTLELPGMGDITDTLGLPDMGGVTDTLGLTNTLELTDGAGITSTLPLTGTGAVTDTAAP